MAWPKQSPAAMNAFYGDFDVNGDGVCDLKWQQDNLTTIAPPYPMFYDGKPVKKITVHKKCAESLLRALTRIGETFSAAERKRYQLDRFGGVFNPRKKRGGTGWSIHAWAAAIDIAPEINAFKVKYGSRKNMMPAEAVRIFEEEGWDWGGLWSNGDAMHFQAAKTGQKPSAGAATPVKAPVPATRPTAKPKPAPAPVVKPAAGDPDPVVLALQEALRAKGFSEVGTPDGYFGTFTETAITAWEMYNGLPPTGKMTEGLSDKVRASPDRVLSQARTEATPAEVRQQAPEVKSSFFAKVSAMVVGAAGVAWTVIKGVVENIDGGTQLIQPVMNFLGDIPHWMYGVAVAGGAFWLWHQSRRGEIAGIEAVRSGERR